MRGKYPDKDLSLCSHLLMMRNPADNQRDRNSCDWKETSVSVLNVLKHILCSHHTQCLSVCIEHHSHVTQTHPPEAPDSSNFSG